MADEIIVVNDENQEELAPVSKPDQILEAVQAAKARVDAIKTLRTYALRVTGPEDWVDQNGVPYLTGSGAEKIARALNVGWRNTQFERVELGDGNYMYVYTGQIYWGDIVVDAIGARSSKDPFFTTRYDKDGNKIIVPVSEVNEANVLKAAWTNFIANGIKRLVGLRNVSWEELEKAAGIKRDQVASIKYRKKKEAKGTKEGEEKGKKKSSVMSEKDWKPAFLSHAKKFRATIGDDKVQLVLERFGYEKEDDVDDYEDARKIYDAWKAEETSN